MIVYIVTHAYEFEYSYQIIGVFASILEANKTVELEQEVNPNDNYLVEAWTVYGHSQ